MSKHKAPFGYYQLRPGDVIKIGDMYESSTGQLAPVSFPGLTIHDNAPMIFYRKIESLFNSKGEIKI